MLREKNVSYTPVTQQMYSDVDVCRSPMFSLLPSELVLLMLSHLDDEEILTMVEVDKRCQRVVETIMLSRVTAYLGYEPSSLRTAFKSYRQVGAPRVYGPNEGMHLTVENLVQRKDIRKVSVNRDSIGVISIDGHCKCISFTGEVIHEAENVTDLFAIGCYRAIYLAGGSVVCYSRVEKSLSTLVPDIGDVELVAIYGERTVSRGLYFTVFYLTKNNLVMVDSDTRKHSVVLEDVIAYFFQGNLLCTTTAVLHLVEKSGSVKRFAPRIFRAVHSVKKVVRTEYWQAALLVDDPQETPLIVHGNNVTISSLFVKDIGVCDLGFRLVILYHDGTLTELDPVTNSETLIDTNVISLGRQSLWLLSFLKGGSRPN